MATLRNIAISLLHLAGITQINRTLQAISRNPGRVLDLIPAIARHLSEFSAPVQKGQRCPAISRRSGLGEFAAAAILIRFCSR